MNFSITCGTSAMLQTTCQNYFPRGLVKNNGRRALHHDSVQASKAMDGCRCTADSYIPRQRFNWSSANLLAMSLLQMAILSAQIVRKAHGYGYEHSRWLPGLESARQTAAHRSEENSLKLF